MFIEIKWEAWGTWSHKQGYDVLRIRKITEITKAWQLQSWSGSMYVGKVIKRWLKQKY